MGWVLAVAAGSADAFAVGLVIGAFIGLLAAPVVRSAIVWREWRRASREARLTDELLERIEHDDGGSLPSDAGTASRDRSWQPSL